uniref:EF-hand domain-containing protein n=1 Tax=Haptolina ericina TaxID=156174 RepID=A0A7S3BR19_9EUKA
MPSLNLDFPDSVVEDLFTLIDIDGSGSITKTELSRAIRWVQSCKKCRLLRAAGISQEADSDVMHQLREALTANAVRVIDLFREWDEDGDGVIDKLEFRRALPMLGLHAPLETVDALFDSFDLDGSGTIGFKELNRLLRRDIKAEEATNERRRASQVRMKPEVVVADVVLLRRQLMAEGLGLDPFAALPTKE